MRISPITNYRTYVNYTKSNNHSTPVLSNHNIVFGGRREEVLARRAARDKLNSTIAKMKNDLKQAINENDVFKILNYLKFEPVADKKGLISIAKYSARPSAEPFTLKDLEIDEN